MKASTVESSDPRSLSADLLHCQIVLSAEMESDPSQQPTQVAQRLAISRELEQYLYGRQNREDPLAAKQALGQARTARKGGCPTASPS